MRTRQFRNRDSGNMLMMTVMCVTFLLFICIVAFGFYMLISEQKRGQATVDNLAMDLAKQMNENDRIGQLNQLIEMNRELVYASRYVSDNTQRGNLYFCSTLAAQLLDEARSSNTDLEKARIQQIDMSKKAARFWIDKYNLNTKSSAEMRLPWWESYQPQISEVTFGYIANTASNVPHNSNVFLLLDDWDTQNRYVQTKSNLYFGNIDAKLPDADNDLSFKFCSIPAPVDKTVAPTRMVNSEVFARSGLIYQDGKTLNYPPGQIPTAVQVVAKMDVTSTHNRESVRIGSAAACNGAIPPPEMQVNDGGMKNKGWGNGKGWGT